MRRLSLALLCSLACATAAQAATLTPDFTANNTDFATFGIGQMRGNGTGTLVVSGITGAVTRAVLYWHGNTSSTSATANASVNFAGTAITGTNIGVSSNNCWGGVSHAYRADVTGLVGGNGNHALSNFFKADADINGAQLLVFYNDGNAANDRNVSVYGGNDSNQTFAAPPDASGWAGTFVTPSYTSGPAWLHLAVSDGQSAPDGALTVGSWVQAMAFNGLTSQIGNGLLAGPVDTHLWDSQRADISSTLVPGVNTLAYSSPAVSDCLSLVVAALDFAAPAPTADLAITKTDGATSATPGGSLTYTITASNAGPSNAPGATVADTLPAALTGATWTCVGAGGGTCTAAGTGNINDPVNLPAGASVTYTLTATVSPSATGTLSNTATVTPPAGVTDTNPANNSATDTDTLATAIDLVLLQTLSNPAAAIGSTVDYTLTVSNTGPSTASGATVTDNLPAGLTNATWTCVGAGGGTCAASGAGNVNDVVDLPAGASVTYTLTATVNAPGTLVNTASVTAPAGVTEANTANNTASTTLAGVAQQPIPTLSTWALGMLVGLLMLATRRRRVH